MSKTVSKGAMFGVNLEIDEAQLKRLKSAPDYVGDVMQENALYWHSGILPQHFTRAAHGTYGFAQRSAYYLRKKGASPDLVKSGAMKAELISKAQVRRKGKTGGVELKLTARALNFVPNSNNPLDLYTKRSDGKKYPNMKREIRMIVENEEKQLSEMAQTKLAALLSGE